MFAASKIYAAEVLELSFADVGPQTQVLNHLASLEEQSGEMYDVAEDFFCMDYNCLDKVTHGRHLLLQSSVGQACYLIAVRIFDPRQWREYYQFLAYDDRGEFLGTNCLFE